MLFWLPEMDFKVCHICNVKTACAKLYKIKGEWYSYNTIQENMVKEGLLVRVYSLKGRGKRYKKVIIVRGELIE